MNNPAARPQGIKKLIREILNSDKLLITTISLKGSGLIAAFISAIIR